MTTRLDQAIEAYVAAFKELPPSPYAISHDRIAEELERAVAAGTPISEDFDWWGDLPPDAAA